MTIGERIKETRKGLGWTQAQLAEKSGVAVITIRQYEAGNRTPKAEQIHKVASALNVSVDWLFSGEEYQIYEDVAQNVMRFLDIQSPRDKKLCRVISSKTETLFADEYKKKGYCFSIAESDLVREFGRLNKDGQEKALDFLEILLGNPEYKK